MPDPLLKTKFSLVAACCRLAEAGERIQVAHEGIAANVRRGALGWLRGGVRSKPQEPREVHFVLRMVVPVGALSAVRVRTLFEGVGAHGEADRNYRVAGLENPTTSVLGSGWREPRLHSVVHERIVGPFGNLVAQRVNILQRPVRTAVRPRVDAGLDPRGPGKRLYFGISVAVTAAAAVTHGASSVETDHTAVEHVLALEEQDIVG